MKLSIYTIILAAILTGCGAGAKLQGQNLQTNDELIYTVTDAEIRDNKVNKG
jgi:hypothetical protein